MANSLHSRFSKSKIAGWKIELRMEVARKSIEPDGTFEEAVFQCQGGRIEGKVFPGKSAL